MSDNLVIVKQIIQAIEKKRLISYKYTPAIESNKIPEVIHYISEPVTLCVGITTPNNMHFYLYALVKYIDNETPSREGMLISFRLDRFSELQIIDEFVPTKIEDNAFRDTKNSLVDNVPLLFPLICVHNNVNADNGCSCKLIVQEDNHKIEIRPKG